MSGQRFEKPKKLEAQGHILTSLEDEVAWSVRDVILAYTKKHGQLPAKVLDGERQVWHIVGQCDLSGLPIVHTDSVWNQPNGDGDPTLILTEAIKAATEGTLSVLRQLAAHACLIQPKDV